MSIVKWILILVLTLLSLIMLSLYLKVRYVIIDKYFLSTRNQVFLKQKTKTSRNSKSSRVYYFFLTFCICVLRSSTYKIIRGFICCFVLYLLKRFWNPGFWTMQVRSLFTIFWRSTNSETIWFSSHSFVDWFQ